MFAIVVQQKKTNPLLPTKQFPETIFTDFLYKNELTRFTYLMKTVQF